MSGSRTVQAFGAQNGIAPQREPVAHVTRNGGVTTIALQGEIDLSNAPVVQEAIEHSCKQRPAKLVLDLEAVTFIDSTALDLFVTTHRRLTAKGCSLVLASPSELVWRTFVITNLDRHLVFQDAPVA